MVFNMQTSRFDFDKISNYNMEFSVSRSALEKRKIRYQKYRGKTE